MSDNKLKLLGIEVGTHDGWDDVGEPGAFVILDFIPNDAFKGKIDPGTFLVNYDEGLLQYSGDDGKLVKSIRITDALATELFKATPNIFNEV